MVGNKLSAVSDHDLQFRPPPQTTRLTSGGGRNDNFGVRIERSDDSHAEISVRTLGTGRSANCPMISHGRRAGGEGLTAL